jgi:hypothetical protein
VAFFDKFGFVVVRDVLTPQEAQATVDEIFGLLEVHVYLGLGLSERHECV